MTIIAIALAALAILAFFVVRRRRKRRSLVQTFSRLVHRKTIDALLSEGEDGELHDDGFWLKGQERDFFARYGPQWIAVVGRQVLAVTSDGDEAWRLALAQPPHRKPFVKRLSPGDPSA